jgi:hypothetical protein
MRPEVVAAAHKLNDGRSLRVIAAALAAQGFVTRSGRERFCSDLASPLLRAQQENDQAQARLGFDAFDLPLFKGKV